MKKPVRNGAKAPVEVARQKPLALLNIFALVVSMTISCKPRRMLSESLAEQNSTDDPLLPREQERPLTNGEVATLAKNPNNGHLAFDLYRQLLSELAYNQPNSPAFSRIGVSSPPADTIYETVLEGKSFIVRIPEGARLIGQERFQVFFRQLNFFLTTSQFTSETGTSRALQAKRVRDVPQNLTAEFADGRIATDFGATGLRLAGNDLIISLDVGSISELRAQQAIVWLTAHALTGDYYGVPELAPAGAKVIPAFADESALRAHLEARFAKSAAKPDGLTSRELDAFLTNFSASLSGGNRLEAFAALPLLWDWESTYLGAWTKAVHRTLSLDAVRAIAQNGPLTRADSHTYLSDYRAATRMLQHQEHLLEPRSGLERYDLSLLPLEGLPFNVNHEEGNFEITAKMPVAPVLRKVLNEATGKKEFVEVLIDLTFAEKKALLRQYAELLAEAHGPGSRVEDVSGRGGGHGHDLVINFKVTVQTTAGEHQYTVELDGQSREYEVENGEFKISTKTVRGGSLEAVGGKMRLTQAYLLLRFFAAEQLGLFPLRQSGGGHLTTGMQNYLRHAEQTGNGRALARLFWLVHRFQGVFAYMVMDPRRVKGAMPFYFEPKEAADRVPESMLEGRRPFRNIDQLLEFDGSVAEFWRRLVDSRYFCDRRGRKMKYLFMNVLQALGNHLDPKNIGPDFDIKKGLWYPWSPVKGDRLTDEIRGFDAPRNAFEAMLQLRLRRAIDAWALSGKGIPNGVVSQETFLDYEYFTKNPDVAAAEFKRFMGILGFEGGFDKLYEVFLWRRMVNVHHDLRVGSHVSPSEQLKGMPRQFAEFGPGLKEPRTSAQTEALLKNKVIPPLSDADRERVEVRQRILAEEKELREKELARDDLEVRLRRKSAISINAEPRRAERSNTEPAEVKPPEARVDESDIIPGEPICRSLGRRYKTKYPQ